MSEDRQALEQLVMDQDLEELENLLDEFNIFEVLGAVRVELRHSEFLAYLMNPQQSHGLGDDFVKKFLQRVIVGADQFVLPVSTIDIDFWDLEDIEVRREWKNIDILILSFKYKFVVVIENKVFSSEHSDQLSKYRKVAENQFPGWKILYIFLTREGDQPSDDAYIPISYELVAELIDTTIETKKTVIGPDIFTLVNHYAVMLRRHILSNSETQKLARKIFKRHQKALEYIYEYKPDQQFDVSEMLAEIIRGSSKVKFTKNSKSRVYFTVSDWDRLIKYSSEDGSKDIQLLLCEIINEIDQVSIKIYIGPGPIDKRQILLDFAHGNKELFKSATQNLNESYNTIYSYKILKKKDYKDSTIDDLREKSTISWNDFLETDFSLINKLIVSRNWD
jgi:hypothetical protein